MHGHTDASLSDLECVDGTSTLVDDRTQMALPQVWNYFGIFGQNSLGECVNCPCSVPMGIRSTR